MDQQVSNITRKTKFSCNKEHIKLPLFYWALYPKINNFVGHKNKVDTCDVRIRPYWECTNSTLPSIVRESIWYMLWNNDLLTIWC